jgi:hypothetical protein
VRLVLHTAAYWLMLTVRDAIDKPHRHQSPARRTVTRRVLRPRTPLIPNALTNLIDFAMK